MHLSSRLKTWDSACRSPSGCKSNLSQPGALPRAMLSDPFGVKPNCTSLLQLEDRLQLHTRAERELTHAQRRAGVPAGFLAEDLLQQVCRAVNHHVAFGEVWVGVHVTGHADHAFDAVER